MVSISPCKEAFCDRKVKTAAVMAGSTCTIDDFLPNILALTVHIIHISYKNLLHIFESQ